VAETVQKVCSILDPAVDLLAMGETVRDYIQKRDPALVKTRAGQNPAWFHLRRVPTSLYMRFVAEASSDADRRRRAFQASLVYAENVTLADGRTFSQWEPRGTTAGPNGPIPFVTDQDLDAFTPATVEEIGAIAEARSFLAEGSAITYTLPPTLPRALAHRISQDAEAVMVQESSSPAPEPQATP
jgi:hypothetical protein